MSLLMCCCCCCISFNSFVLVYLIHSQCTCLRCIIWCILTLLDLWHCPHSQEKEHTHRPPEVSSCPFVISFILFSSFPSPGNCPWEFFHCRLVHIFCNCISGIIFYVFLAWLLFTQHNYLRLIHVFVCISSDTYWYIAEFYSIVLSFNPFCG